MLTEAFADFPSEEYEGRMARLRGLMEAEGLDAVLLTTDTNIRYFTGHATHRWMHKFTALFALLPLKSGPVLIAPPLEAGQCALDSWVEDVRVYAGGRNRAGVGTITEVVRELGLEQGRVGMELGGVLWMRMPYEDFGELQRGLPQVAFVDASQALWRARFRKSAAEVDYIRRAVEITDGAYRALFEAVRPGMTEREVHRFLAVEQMRRGAETPGSITVASHPAQDFRSSDRSHRRHTDRALSPGDLVIMDAGCVYRGYWSDYTRMFGVGRARAECRDAYRVIHECLQEVLDGIRPGVAMSELTGRVVRKLKASGFEEQAGRVGNIGHACGLDIIEPPFMVSDEQNLLEEGMILTVEPSMYTDYGFFMIEEDVLVTDRGCQVLSAPASAELTII